MSNGGDGETDPFSLGVERRAPVSRSKAESDGWISVNWLHTLALLRMSESQLWARKEAPNATPEQQVRRLELLKNLVAMGSKEISHSISLTIKTELQLSLITSFEDEFPIDIDDCIISVTPKSTSGQFSVEISFSAEACLRLVEGLEHAEITNRMTEIKTIIRDIAISSISKFNLEQKGSVNFHSNREVRVGFSCEFPQEALPENEISANLATADETLAAFLLVAGLAAEKREDHLQTAKAESRAAIYSHQRDAVIARTLGGFQGECTEVVHTRDNTSDKKSAIVVSLYIDFAEPVELSQEQYQSLVDELTTLYSVALGTEVWMGHGVPRRSIENPGAIRNFFTGKVRREVVASIGFQFHRSDRPITGTSELDQGDS